MGLEGLENLFIEQMVSWRLQLQDRKIGDAYLKLNLGLSNVLLAATAVGNLLGLSNLVADSLKLEHHMLVSHALSQKKSDATYLGTEVLKGKTLDGVDAQLRVGLDNGEATGHCRKGKKYVSEYSRVCRKALFRYAARERGSDIRKYCLVAPPSSTISTRPGLSCSMEGTWLARTPISPEAAGMLTWVLWSRFVSIQGADNTSARGEATHTPVER